MPHGRIPRWPQLCDYEDRPHIQVHWPNYMHTSYALAPALNVKIINPEHEGVPGEVWSWGTRLWHATKTGWSYKPTFLGVGDTQIQYSFEMDTRPGRDWYDFTTYGFIWGPDMLPVGQGKVVKQYGGRPWRRGPVWRFATQFSIELYWHESASVFCQLGYVGIKNMWNETPVQL